MLHQPMSGTTGPASTVTNNPYWWKLANIRTKRVSRRPLAAVISAVLVASVLALVSGLLDRLRLLPSQTSSGVDRYATSAATATLAYPSGSNNVCVGQLDKSR